MGIERVTLDWVLFGGESGRHARPMHPDRARSLRDQCKTAGVPFMMKQWGEWHTRYEIAGVPHFAEFESHEQWVNKASSWVMGGVCLDDAGKLCARGADFQTAKFPVTIMHRVGKAGAGRILDGVEHNGMPEVRTIARHCLKCDRTAEACRCAEPNLVEREAKP